MSLKKNSLFLIISAHSVVKFVVNNIEISVNTTSNYVGYNYYNMFRPLGVIFRSSLGTDFTSVFAVLFFIFALGIHYALQVN